MTRNGWNVTLAEKKFYELRSPPEKNWLKIDPYYQRQNVGRWFYTAQNLLGIKQWLHSINHKKAELSQRWPRDAPYAYGRPENFQESLTTPRLLFPKFLMSFGSDCAYKCAYKIRSLTSAWDNRGYCTWKNGQSLDMRTPPFLQNF